LCNNISRYIVFYFQKIFPFLIISGKKSIVKLVGMNKTSVSNRKESTELGDVKDHDVRDKI
jgi:hypothetical protein